MRPVSGLFAPRLYDFPINVALRVHSDSGVEFAFEVSLLKQLAEVVGMDAVNEALVRECMSLELLADRGLERAFDRVASKIISAIVHPSIKEALSFRDSRGRHAFEFGAAGCGSLRRDCA